MLACTTAGKQIIHPCVSDSASSSRAWAGLPLSGRGFINDAPFPVSRPAQPLLMSTMSGCFMMSLTSFRQSWICAAAKAGEKHLCQGWGRRWVLFHRSCVLIHTLSGILLYSALIFRVNFDISGPSNRVCLSVFIHVCMFACLRRRYRQRRRHGCCWVVVRVLLTLYPRTYKGTGFKKIQCTCGHWHDTAVKISFFFLLHIKHTKYQSI